MPQFVITGAPRSGTLYMARLLTLAGVPCSHEELFDPRTLSQLDQVLAAKGKLHSWKSSDRKATYGEISWMAVPYLDILGSEIVLLHQVRHPLTCAASLLGRGFGIRGRARHPLVGTSIVEYEDFFAKHAPEAYAQKTEQDRCLAFWIRWNEYLLDNRVKLTYRVEGVDLHLLETICELIGVSVPRADLIAALETVPTNTHHGVSPAWTWDSFDPVLAEKAQTLGAAYGYTYEDPTQLTYEIALKDNKPTITCLVCKMTSHHHEDIKRKFCGKCSQFHPITAHR